MTALQEKIKELEAKHRQQLKAEKAKLMSQYRAAEKKKQQAQAKQFLTKFGKLKSQINNDAILLGGLVRTLEQVKSGDQDIINQLIDLSKTLAD
jgi:menaquinone-dependent protoporphyrinogen IX oxidase